MPAALSAQAHLDFFLQAAMLHHVQEDLLNICKSSSAASLDRPAIYHISLRFIRNICFRRRQEWFPVYDGLDPVDGAEVAEYDTKLPTQRQKPARRLLS